MQSKCGENVDDITRLHNVGHDDAPATSNWEKIEGDTHVADDEQSSDSDSDADSEDGPPPEWHKKVPKFAWKILAGMDYIGEGLADFFGITTPKYQWVIDEYERMKAEEERLDELERSREARVISNVEMGVMTKMEPTKMEPTGTDES